MGVFATAGGAGQAMDVVPLLGCGCGVLLVAVLAVVSVALRSYWFAGMSLLLAVSQAALAISAVIDFVPSDDPDESHMEGLVWRLAFWAAVQVVIAVVTLAWVIVRRRKPLSPGPPNPYAEPTL